MLFLLCTLGMVMIRVILPHPMLISFPFNFLGIILLAMGMAMVVSMARLFQAKETEIHTFKTPRKIVTEGLFQYSRNPIYLGFTMALVGVWVLLGNLPSLVGVLVFFVIAHFWYIPFEEKNMEQEFGSAYLTYKSRVRRWV